jgi:hypothetical protein
MFVDDAKIIAIQFLRETLVSLLSHITSDIDEKFHEPKS